MSPILGTIAAGSPAPSAPTIGTATDGGTGTTVSVAFTPSTYIGKETITYTATSSPDNITATSSSSPITVTGLTTGTAYTFTVTGTTNYGVSSTTSASSNSVTPADPGAFNSIASFLLTSSTSVINFTSIPQTFTHLQIRTMASSTNTSASYAVIDGNMRFNDDSTYPNYEAFVMNSRNPNTGNPTSNSATAGELYTNLGVVYEGANTTLHAISIVDIYNYTLTNKKKSVNSMWGAGTNNASNLRVSYGSGVWKSNSAITKISLYPTIGQWASGSIFSLYGIKGS
jgi:hypothetical protein